MTKVTDFHAYLNAGADQKAEMEVAFKTYQDTDTAHKEAMRAAYDGDDFIMSLFKYRAGLEPFRDGRHLKVRAAFEAQGGAHSEWLKLIS